jgi:hypothetical protein
MMLFIFEPLIAPCMNRAASSPPLAAMRTALFPAQGEDTGGFALARGCGHPAVYARPPGAGTAHGSFVASRSWPGEGEGGVGHPARWRKGQAWCAECGLLFSGPAVAFCGGGGTPGAKWNADPQPGAYAQVQAAVGFAAGGRSLALPGVRGSCCRSPAQPVTPDKVEVPIPEAIRQRQPGRLPPGDLSFHPATGH